MNAIIFDFDGTIADSFDVVVEFLAKKAGKQPTLQQKDDLRGLAMKDVALQLGIPAWRLPLIYFQGKTALTKHMHRMPAFAGMPEALAALKRENYQLYIMSSNSKRNITRFLVQHGLGGYFRHIYGNAGWFDKGRTLKRTLRQNKLDATKTMYVGDEPRDIIGAHAAGMPAVAVNWGFSTDAALLKHNPTVLVRTPAELQKVLVDLGKTV